MPGVKRNNAYRPVMQAEYFFKRLVSRRGRQAEGKRQKAEGRRQKAEGRRKRQKTALQRVQLPARRQHFDPFDMLRGRRLSDQPEGST
jgi:hypothetical protein